jgi:hypothetical protein
MKHMKEKEIQRQLCMCAEAIGEPTPERVEKYLTVRDGFHRLCKSIEMNNGEIAHAIEFIREMWHLQLAKELEENK